MSQAHQLRCAVLLGSLLCALATPTAAQQRTLVPVTSSGEDHSNPVPSPNGQLVAYRGPSKIAVVPWNGGAEVTLASGTNLGSFVWTPDSRGIYYLEGTLVNFVAAGGGLPRQVYALPELSHQIWDIKNDESELVCSWLYVRNNGSTTVRETHVFMLRADGTAAPRVIAQSVLAIDGVQLSPDEQRLLWRQYDTTPFTPRDYVVANVDGSNQVSLTGGTGFGLNPSFPVWDATGTGVFCWRTDINLGRPVIERFALPGNARTVLSTPAGARELSVSADGAWIICQGYWAPGATWTPMLIPATGGGHVYLDTSRPLGFSGAPQVSVSDRVVMAGRLGTSQISQVLRCELAREMLVRPRAEVGGSVTIELPVLPGESGVIVLSSTLLPTPVELPGFAGSFQLDPAGMVTLLSGVGNGAPLGMTLPIPNVNFLRRKSAYLQALRLLSLSQGDFTRLVELPIF